MSSKNNFKITAIITLKKIKSAKSLYLFGALIIVILAYVWIKDSPATVLKFFLFLFPYFFLVLVQDLILGDIESGSLENIIFVRWNFRTYLLEKNTIIAITGGLLSLSLFLMLILAAPFSRRVEIFDFAFFGVGLIVGVYYISLGGFLSYFMKSGSNVLVIFLGQAALFVLLMASAGSNIGFIKEISSGSFPDIMSRLKFAGLVAIFPNIVVSKIFLPWAIELMGLSTFFFWLQSRLAIRLELKK